MAHTTQQNDLKEAKTALDAVIKNRAFIYTNPFKSQRFCIEIGFLGILIWRD